MTAAPGEDGYGGSISRQQRNQQKKEARLKAEKRAAKKAKRASGEA